MSNQLILAAVIAIVAIIATLSVLYYMKGIEISAVEYGLHSGSEKKDFAKASRGELVKRVEILDGEVDRYRRIAIEAQSQCDLINSRARGLAQPELAVSEINLRRAANIIRLGTTDHGALSAVTAMESEFSMARRLYDEVAKTIVAQQALLEAANSQLREAGLIISELKRSSTAVVLISEELNELVANEEKSAA